MLGSQNEKISTIQSFLSLTLYRKIGIATGKILVMNFRTLIDKNMTNYLKLICAVPILVICITLRRSVNTLTRIEVYVLR